MKNPNIRFIDDNADWEEKKLKNIYNSSCSGGTPESTNPLYYNGFIPFLTISDISDKKNIKNTEKSITEMGLLHSTARIVPSGSIALAMYASVGKVAILNIDMATSQAFYNMTFKNNITRDFIYQKLKNKEINNEWESIISTGTQRNLNSEKIENVVISIPHLEIQQKISSLLSNIDQKINAEETLIQKLKDVKSAMLSKMFPQEKQSVPELRFVGFNNAWEQCKLGDVVQITMGQSPDGNTYSDKPSDYILVQGNADLQNGWVFPRVWTTQITKKANAGDLIMSVRAPAGTVGKTAYNIVIGRGIAAIKGNEFIYQTLVKMYINNFWKSFSCGSTFESLNLNDIKNAKIKIPIVFEQSKIGNLFSNFDHLITLHQCKLKKYKEIKSALLDKLLV